MFNDKNQDERFNTKEVNIRKKRKKKAPLYDEIDFKALIESSKENTRELYTKEELHRRMEYESYEDNRARKEKDRYSLFHDMSSTSRSIIISAVSAIIGLIVGLALIIGFLPKTEMFKNSALGKYIKETSNIAAYDAASSLNNKLITSDSRAEAPQRQSSGRAKFSIPDIVSQYQSAVVTVVTKVNYSPDDPEGLNSKNFIGTGFILDSDGNIATNYHVIEGASVISVILSDGSEFQAKLINTDVPNDLAIINIIDEVKLPGVVTFGNSDDIKVGDEVVAIGNPLNRNFAGTVTAGIVSAKEREIEIEGTKIKYIQTDAAINQGNSGGPLFNLNGEVIGINTAKLKQQGIEGIGFAIPINILKEKLAILSVPPVYMGITTKDMNQEAIAQNEVKNGVKVVSVLKNSPAFEAGIKEGDIVLKFDGVDITSTAQMNELKAKKKIGDEVELTIYHEAEVKKIVLTLIERP